MVVLKKPKTSQQHRQRDRDQDPDQNRAEQSIRSQIPKRKEDEGIEKTRVGERKTTLWSEARTKMMGNQYHLPEDVDEDELDEELAALEEELLDQSIEKEFEKLLSAEFSSLAITRYHALMRKHGIDKELLAFRFKEAAGKANQLEKIAADLQAFGKGMSDAIRSSLKGDESKTADLFAGYITMLHELAGSIKESTISASAIGGLVRNLSSTLGEIPSERRKVCINHAYLGQDKQWQKLKCPEGEVVQLLDAFHAAQAYKEFLLDMDMLMDAAGSSTPDSDDDGESEVEPVGDSSHHDTDVGLITYPDIGQNIDDGNTTPVNPSSGIQFEDSTEQVENKKEPVNNSLPQDFFLNWSQPAPLPVSSTSLKPHVPPASQPQPPEAKPSVSLQPTTVSNPPTSSGESLYPSLEGLMKPKPARGPQVPDRNLKPRYFLDEFKPVQPDIVKPAPQPAPLPAPVLPKDTEQKKRPQTKPVTQPEPQSLPWPAPARAMVKTKPVKPNKQQEILDTIRNKVNEAGEDTGKQKELTSHINKLVEVSDRRIVEDTRDIADRKTTKGKIFRRMGTRAGLRALTEVVVPPDLQPREVMKANEKQPWEPSRVYRTLIALLEEPLVCYRDKRKIIMPEQVRKLSQEELRPHVKRLTQTCSEKNRQVALKNLPVIENFLANRHYPFRYYEGGRDRMDAGSLGEDFRITTQDVYEGLIGFPFCSFETYFRIQDFKDNVRRRLLCEMFSEKTVSFIFSVLNGEAVRSNRCPDDAGILGRVQHTSDTRMALRYSPSEDNYYLQIIRKGGLHICRCGREANAYFQKDKGCNVLFQAIGVPMIRDDPDKTKMVVPRFETLPYKPTF
ncbi:hypothetical protein [Parendozoicomonas haliclonae]|uniref:Uncharacterized protein n=1 Tax=Parendozoicomonas haliclonae TaxID=1960125 RepID=A0A1X7AGQ3_9GAMM|nr:hypothetical protein [Parendozoicomonas haliclonae]SMA38791.1 hypothetical protein EHSB41UT_00928 [Parendozoicomonas haliclonae]